MENNIDRPYPIVEGAKNLAGAFMFLAITGTVALVAIAVLLWSVRIVF